MTRPKHAQDQPVGTHQLDGTVMAGSSQAPRGAHQHPKAHRIDEADLAKINHQPTTAGIDRLVQALAQLRRAGDVDLAANLYHGKATRGGDVQVKERNGHWRPRQAGYGVLATARWLASVRAALPRSVSTRGRRGKLAWAATVRYRLPFAVLVTRLEATAPTLHRGLEITAGGSADRRSARRRGHVVGSIARGIARRGGSTPPRGYEPHGGGSSRHSR